MRAAFLFLPLAGCQLILGIESATLDTTPDAAVPDAGYPNALVTVADRHAWEGGSGTISW